MTYPFYSLELQEVENIEVLMNTTVEDPWMKYRNIQFLLHLEKLFGQDEVVLFITQFFSNPD